jgi:hydroxymethylpyrimidine pyrophosphatase-like HAD family hydrolase
MGNTIFINMIGLGICTILFSCNGTKIHQAKFYSKLGEGVKQEGFHHNEAQRVIDLNEKNEVADQKKAVIINEQTSETLNKLNKPNMYNSIPKKAKKKRFTYYL